MKRAMFAIMKKELRRFFGDKKLVFSTIILPGLLIFVIYMIMGLMLVSEYFFDSRGLTECLVKNPVQDDVLAKNLAENFTMIDVSGEQTQDAIDAVRENEADLFVIFPEDFADAVREDLTDSPLQIQAYYNSAKSSSAAAYSLFCQVMDAYEQTLVNCFDINAGGETYDLAQTDDVMASLFSSLLPMFLMLFAFTGASTAAIESIAGEKERGTIATLLVTPVKRYDIAFGKLFGLSVVAMLSGLSGILGTVVSFAAMFSAFPSSYRINIYSGLDYLLLTLVLLSTVLLFVIVISVISAFAKSIREAQSYSAPLMILAVFLGISCLFTGGTTGRWFVYCIPAYNSVQAMTHILSFSFSAQSILLTVGTNVVVTFLGVLLLAKMFDSEKIIFS